MEKFLNFKTKDGHTIYGTLNTTAKPSRSVIVFVHGLTGHQNEHYFYNAARLFPKKGFDTYRFDLYNGDKGGRSLSDCTVQTHASDLSVVLSQLKKKYKNIHVVGHSLGGPTIVLADISCVQSVVLWDPSDMLGLVDIIEGQERKLKQNKISGLYIVDWGTEYILGRGMAEEFRTLRPAILAGTINKPLKIIAAEKGNPRASKTYFKHANDPKELVILKNCGHTFDEEGKEEELLKETLLWVKKWNK
ncbi:MAG TPA: alpha/beta fold hydrolase [Candidatus Paceibacterota bacterium]|nr:alpha/beta fold hydrolase [Candidatus Paceibacterota bacterium]